jgi:hypothetical protein
MSDLEDVFDTILHPDILLQLIRFCHRISLKGKTLIVAAL